MNKNKRKTTRVDLLKQVGKLPKSRKMVTALGVVAFLFFLGIGYGITQVYAQLQKEKQAQEQKSAQTAQQLKDLSDTMSHLKQENEQLKVTPALSPSLNPIAKRVVVPQASPSPVAQKDKDKEIIREELLRQMIRNSTTHTTPTNCSSQVVGNSMTTQCY
jgi:hypothetical protein